MEVLGINKKSLNILDITVKTFSRTYEMIPRVVFSEAPPPPPPSLGRRSISCLDVLTGKLAWIRLNFTPYHLLMSTKLICTENYEI